MNLLSPTPLWPIADGLPATYPALEEDLVSEVAVLGGGITGALVAWHLAEAGVGVVVLDRREVAHGSTAGSTSLLQYEVDEPLHRLAQRYGLPQAQRCYRRSLEAVRDLGRLAGKLKIDCGYEAKSSLLLASAQAHVPRLRREFEARRAAGFDVEWWPRRRFAAGNGLPHAAGIHSSDGAQVDAYRLSYGLFHAACRRGARVYDRTGVVRIRRRARSVELATELGFSVRARHLVIATGYEADAHLPKRATSLHSTYALASEPTAGFEGWPGERSLIWETADPYTYLRTTEDGRAIIGGADEPFRTGAARDRRLPEKTRLLERRFRRWFPKMSFVTAYSWAGTFAATKDGLPLIGRRPDVPHTWFALGYGGNGITYSLIAAQLIRDGVLGRKNPDEHDFGFSRGR